MTVLPPRQGAPNNPWTGGCLVMVGVSYHGTAVELRERLVVEHAHWQEITRDLAPSVLLCTCNRTEVYAWAMSRPGRMVSRLKTRLARATGVPAAELEPHVVARTGRVALAHLVRVTSGLDSLVVGEEQIRGQVREAHRLARAQGGIPAPLDGVFARALEAGRRVRGLTRLGHHPSVAAAGVDVARRTPELTTYGLQGQPAVVLGAGVMAKSAARALLAHGTRVTIVNRTAAHAERVARELGGGTRCATFDELGPLLEETALLVGATASRTPMIDVAALESALERRAGRPLVVLDVALPRDVEPAARALAGIRLIDLDDLERLCPVDEADRRSELNRVEAMAAAEAEQIHAWLRVRGMSGAIAELRQHGEEIRALELRRAAARLRDLTPEQRAAVDVLSEAIVKKLLHGPTIALRESAVRPRSPRGQSRQAVLNVLRFDRSRHRRTAV